jgi:hypothetical protein
LNQEQLLHITRLAYKESNILCVLTAADLVETVIETREDRESATEKFSEVPKKIVSSHFWFNLNAKLCKKFSNNPPMENN